MNVIDNTPEPNDTELSANVTDTGTAGSSNSPAVSPEDKPYLDAVRAMDPFKDVPGVVVTPLGRKFPAPTLEALDPEARAVVRARMASAGLSASEQAARETEFVQAHLVSQLPRIRIMTGLGDEATPLHREECLLARERFDLVSEYNRYEDMLSEIASYRTEVDPATGEPCPVPVFAVQGQRREAYLAHMDDIARRADLLVDENGNPGHEGQARLRAAGAETVALLKAREEALAEREEAKRRGVEIAREARINKQAASIARMASPSL